ncbi:MAG TPA: PTS sugar transporter subunit IIB [Elusimicrobiota bacterium]|nr:PTS sugar transporter subunit IIB [Elusimicrobiota bacterium]
MAVSLLRLDDRLVHGQVVEGWLKALRLTHMVVASDSVAADETQKALYDLAVPHGIQLECLRIADAATQWKSKAWESEKILMLVASPHDAWKLFESGAPIRSVNVGGLHFREGRVQVLKAISLDDDDVGVLRRLAAQGVVLEARPLPLDEPVDLTPYLSRWQQDRRGLQDQPR